ncbi:MAG TPA: glycoside hydrolase family 3 N-terminal domain-containing protein [Kiritimatiellia bacterium]|nr:glycoside hydrolase family 3 N-terminal domain-containing protein [Kiritimatiellia bacterium]
MKPPESPETAQNIEDLLRRMTLEEKVGQTLQYNGADDDALEQLHNNHVGSFLHVMGEKLEALKEAAGKTRLGIPLLFGIDAIRGHGLWRNATLFPTQMALSCSWNPDLLEEVARITAREVRATGPQWTFSPQLDICRDIRWGRMGETFGEDPRLTGALAAAMVRGYQGSNLADEEAIAACPKHFIGYGETVGARDGTEADVTRRTLEMVFLPPFRQAVHEAGAATVMAAYNAVDGTLCSLHHELLTGVLRDQWGFDGFVVSDWDNVGRAVYQKQVCTSIREAGVKALRAGNDMAMSTKNLAGELVAAVTAGELAEDVLDQAVRRILRIKFRLGLFDQPARRGIDREKIRTVINCPAHRAASLEASRQSLVLMTNHGILPLAPERLRSIAVLGPNADDLFGTVGGWVIGSPQAEFPDAMHDRDHIVTVLDGIKARFASATVVHERACCVVDQRHAISGWFTQRQPGETTTPPEGGMERATELARSADVAVVVVGDTMALQGEANDRADMDISGGQMELLHAVKATGTPMIVVLLVGKPHTIGWIKENADAVVCGWNQGVEGGTAIAELLAGDFNPSGRLTQSWPVSIGQQPVHYNQAPGWHAPRYVDQAIEPLFPFGHGLSYTTFSCGDATADRTTLTGDESVTIAAEVANTGSREGTVIVQCYAAVHAPLVRPARELLQWQRVHLNAGECRRVDFIIKRDDFTFVDETGKRVPANGKAEVWVGLSSRTRDLNGTIVQLAG